MVTATIPMLMPINLHLETALLPWKSVLVAEMVNTAVDSPGAKTTGNVPVPVLSLSGNAIAFVTPVIFERKQPGRKKKKRREVSASSSLLGVVNCHSPFPSWEQQTRNRDNMRISPFRLEAEAGSVGVGAQTGGITAGGKQKMAAQPPSSDSSAANIAVFSIVAVALHPPPPPPTLLLLTLLQGTSRARQPRGCYQCAIISISIGIVIVAVTITASIIVAVFFAVPVAGTVVSS